MCRRPLHAGAMIAAALVVTFGVLAGVAPTVPAAAAPPAARAAPCESPRSVEGPLTRIDKPASLPGPLVAHAVEPYRPEVVYLADDRRVVRSQDAGCTWQVVLDLSTAPLPMTATARIEALMTPDSRLGADRLFVTALETTRPRAFSNPGLPRVFLSRDAGRSFTLVRGLPAVGSGPDALPHLVAAPSDPSIVYAAYSDLSNGALVFRSDDGGATFAPTGGLRTFPDQTTALGGPLGTTALAVDPADPRHVWVSGFSLLSRSRDAGTSWQAVTLSPTSLQHAFAIGLVRSPKDGLTIDYTRSGLSDQPFGAAPGQLSRSTDDGASFAQRPQEPIFGLFQSQGHGATPDERVITTWSDPFRTERYSGPGGTWLYNSDAETWENVAAGEQAPWLDAQVDRAADPAVHLRTSALTSNAPGDDQYLIYDPPAVGRIVPPSQSSDDPPSAPALPPPPSICPDAGPFAPPVPAAPAPAALDPDGTRLAVDPAGRARQDYRLSLPAAPGPVDLWFLLDISGSMGTARDGIICSLETLTSSLAQQGVDLHVGLGTFFGSGPGQRYQRVVDLGPPDLPLQRALRELRTDGGDETHRTALLQTATGQGLRSSVDGSALVEPGQAASFREEAVKVVVQITDEAWLATPDEPTPLAVVDALNERGIEHVGVQVVALENPASVRSGDRVDGVAGQAAVRAQLEQWSIGTATFAPAGGVDCDGDGAADLREGEPLVCTAERSGIELTLGDTLLGLLRGVEDRQPVRLSASAGAGLDVTVTPDRHDGVDLRSDTVHSFSLTAACRPGAAQPVVELTALTGTRAVATTNATVLCTPDPPAAPVPTEPEAAALPPAAPAAPAAPGGPAAPVEPLGGSPGAAAPPPAPAPPAPVVVAAPAPAPAPGSAPGSAPGTAPGAAPGAAPGTAPGAASGTQLGTASAPAAAGAPGSAAAGQLGTAPDAQAAGALAAARQDSPALRRAHAGPAASSNELSFSAQDGVAARRGDPLPLLTLAAGTLAAVAAGWRRRQDRDMSSRPVHALHPRPLPPFRGDRR